MRGLGAASAACARFVTACAGWTLVACSVVVASSAYATVGEVDGSKPSSVQRVVLLHGLGRSALDMAILAMRLERYGHAVCNVDYPTRRDSFESVLVDVRSRIRDCGFDRVPVHYVTHSLGGIVLRGLSREGWVVAGGRAVMIAPPNAGSELADRLGDRPVVGRVLGPIGGQLGTELDDLPQRLPAPAIPFAVIAGDRWINPLGAVWLEGAHDGTVRVESTRLAGMTDHLILPYTHSFITWAAPVADAVDRFLRQGRFAEGPDRARAAVHGGDDRASGD